MGIYFNDINIILLINNDIIEESFKKYPISKLNICIRVRDFNEGRSGNNTRHRYAPSIKVLPYGSGKSDNHSVDGDPIYFGMNNNGDITLKYDKSEFKNSRELNYIKNFIYHNYYHLKNYWFAPDLKTDNNTIKKYQEKLIERIQFNLDNNDYKSYCGVDNEISM